MTEPAGAPLPREKQRARASGASRTAVLGIRHHGPGSARSVAAELDHLKPAVVLVEGPADADPLLALAAAPGMLPPVALLGYAPDEPRVCAFWPFAVFSPEWQALLWAHRNGVPVRFCDLPTGAVLAGEAERDDDDPGDAAPGDAAPGDAAAPAAGGAREGEPRARSDDRSYFSADPIAKLASAAGYDDPERWWDDVIESRGPGRGPGRPGEGVFGALTEAMAELRADWPRPPLGELRREAHMRQVLRAALKQTSGTVAVVCGAWHAPALAGPLGPATADAALLRGLPKRKAALAWVPWTHSRLATASGYGAGVTSPGWYHHLFTTPDQTVARWLTRVAGVLRERDLPASSASVIEAVRLAEALAVLRGRPLAGLAEVSEATLSVLCEGSELAAGYVTRDLVTGEELGQVPPGAPPVPLDADLRRCARSLKLTLEPQARTLDLDLRRDIGRRRSEFLHRLGLLSVGWGTPAESAVRSTGTFRETWTLRWRPELAVAVIDAARWGTTVEAAAAAKLESAAARAAAGAGAGGPGRLADVTDAVVTALLAGLDQALPAVLAALDAVAAADHDVVSLMNAVPALVRAIRYGNVRGTPVASLAAVVDALVARLCAGLPAAVGGLADDAAEELRAAMDELHAALALYGQEPAAGPVGGAPAGTPVAGGDARARWLAALTPAASRFDVHGLIAGRANRMLADAGVLPWSEAAVRFGAALSVGVPAAGKARWAEGFLAGGGLLLAHDRELLEVLDDWVAGLGDAEFTEVLPLLRRSLGALAGPERAAIGRAVRSVRAPAAGAGPAAGGGRGGTDADLDAERAAGAVRTVAAILGGAVR